MVDPVTVIGVVSAAVSTINTIKGWFGSKSEVDFDREFDQINSKLDNVQSSIDELTGLGHTILEAMRQSAAALLVDQIASVYALGETSIRNMQSYRLTGSQGDLDNARNNSAQALININALATGHPDQAQQLIGPMMYLLGVRMRVARELDDAVFAAPAYSPDIQRTADLLNSFADYITSLPNPEPRITISTERVGVFTDRTTTTVYENAPGNYWVTFETVERTFGGVVLSRTERQPRYAEYLNDPILGFGLIFGNFDGSAADAIAMGRQKAFDILGVAQIREAATQVDQLNNGIYDPGTTGDDVRNGADNQDFLRGNAGNDRLNGGNSDDTLWGDDGNDTLDGGADTNILRGGAGDDRLIDSALGADLFDGGAGFDTVSVAGYPLWFVTGVTISLATGYDSYTGNRFIGIEALEGGAGADRLTGNAEANSLAGAAGNDVLEGGGGDDTLLGQQGDDTLAGGDGTDMVHFSDASYDPGAGVIVDLEAGTATGDGTDSLSGIENAAGTAQDDTLSGSAVANYLLGLAGDDLLNGSAGDDVLVGGSGKDTLRGGDGNDTLYGDDVSGSDDGGDRIYGDGGDDVFMLVSAGAGRDKLTGGGGRDTYRLAPTGAYDVVTDFKAGAGGDVIDLSFLSPLDQVDAFVSGLLRLVHLPAGAALQMDLDGGPGLRWTTLLMLQGLDPDNLSAVNFTPSAGFVQRNWVLQGSNGNDTLSAGSGGDTLEGLRGDDELLGNAGTDYLYGGAGNDQLSSRSANDLLDGGAGNDTMIGGTGNDTYVVDNTGDVVTESAGEGTDTVESTISYTLVDNVERLTLTGSGAINGTGNTLANTLTGNTGKNTLDGKAGADTMRGGGGNDTYRVDNAGDVVTELANEGTDAVEAMISYTLTKNVERLTLMGSGAMNGTGNLLANMLTGNAGNNLINGGLGNDTLIGGGGQDTFLFDSKLSGNIDTVADFDATNDRIQLDQSIFTAMTALGTLSAAAFFNGAAAHDTDDRIIYNSATGDLLYDRDGTGSVAAVQFAHLDGAPAIGNTNFKVVA